MEPIFMGPGTAKAVEVLYFEEAEVTKTRSGQPLFATFGPMSVLYFPSYNRFVLQINDWRYPLLRRLSINSSSTGSYTLPGPNGSSFNLKITLPAPRLSNLDAILEGTRKLEASPDDKLARPVKKIQGEAGIKEVITEGIKNVVKKVQEKIGGLKAGSKPVTATKKRDEIRKIKRRNFRKNAHSRINKDFFRSSEKIANEFERMRKSNVNMSKTRKYEELVKTNTNYAAVFYIPKEEVEEAILKSKDMAEAAMVSEKKGTMDRLVGERRAAPEVQGHVEKSIAAEGMTHYQG